MQPASLAVILAAALGLYSIGMSRSADQLAPARQRWHLASFTLGLMAALVILIPSPDLFGPDYRFTVNMGQLLLAVNVAPPLLFLGIPTVMLQPLLRWEALGRRLGDPILVGLVSTILLLGWFVPVLFEAASSNLPIWILKQMVFLLAGLFVYMFVVRVPMILLGIIITFASKLLYTSRSFAAELCAPSSLTDQQIGGLLMWTVGGLIIAIAGSVVLFHWFEAPDTPESTEF
ncbi:MAG: cytochrome c oxidase assembly protein [Anaerolineales bacterium]